MAQTSVLKGVAITGLDQTPPYNPGTGEGAPAFLRAVNDYVTPLAADAIGSSYRVVRIPTYAHVKQVILNSAVASAGAADINVAFSDSTTDGTSSYNVGTIPQVSSANNKLFGAAHSLVAQSQIDVTFANTYTPAMLNEPLWQVLGFASDPGGFFDIYLILTTAITTGGVLSIEVRFTV